MVDGYGDKACEGALHIVYKQGLRIITTKHYETQKEQEVSHS